MDRYAPIESYGLVGNLETCALVGRDGAVDWLPAPHLESASVFARILDADDGGFFRIRPASADAGTHRYRHRTNVLDTTFPTEGGRLTVTDFFAIRQESVAAAPCRALYRKVSAPDGPVTAHVEVEPRFDYARVTPTIEPCEHGLWFDAGVDSAHEGDGDDHADDGDDHAGDGNDHAGNAGHEGHGGAGHAGADGAFLSTDADFDCTEGTATAEVRVAPDDPAWFVFAYGDDHPWQLAGAETPGVPDRAAEDVLERTVRYWREWAHTCDDQSCIFGGPWHEEIVRSGLVLKLLTHRASGAVAAAPTTSLPEEIGGVRNWDYRFNWLRDTAFTLQALGNLRHTKEADRYFEWFAGIIQREDPEDLQPLYGLHGAADLTERILDHLEGYRESTPVRIGNAAADQLQLDTYGELVLAIYETSPHEDYLTEPYWEAVRDIVDHVCEVWDQPDAGIWEVRGGPRQFVFSKVMCWVAVDRGIRLATELDLDAPLEKWREVRGEIHATTVEKGYDEERGTFVQAFGHPDTLDATALLIPVVGFLPPDHDRVVNTIETIQDELATDEGLVYRYDGPDGLPGTEGRFVLCSFWLVDALALLGRTQEAHEIFETILEYANPLGLLAEEIDPESGHQLGNFPQGFSHTGLINSALYLGRLTGVDDLRFEPMGLRRAHD